MAAKSDKATVVLKAVDRVLPGFEEHNDCHRWTEPFFFVQAADTQLGMIVNYGDGTINDQYPDISWDREMELCQLSVQKVNSMDPQPAFFVVCGDMLDAFPDQWPEIRQRQENDFMEVFKDLKVPLVCVCGNHDVGNRPTRDTIAKYRQSFGSDYFSFWKNGVHFIVLNSQLYEDSSRVPTLAEEQEAWLNRELAKPAAHKVVFQHIPWFVQQPQEGQVLL